MGCLFRRNWPKATVLGRHAICDQQNSALTWPAEDAHSGYSIILASDRSTIIIGPAWTRGLAIHPFGNAHLETNRYSAHQYLTILVVILVAIAFGLFFVKHERSRLLSSLPIFVAVFFTAIAFIIDIAFYAHLAQELGGHAFHGHKAKTSGGPAFWLTFISLIFLIVSGCTVFLCGSNDSRDAENTPSFSMPGILARFRKD
ncbi:hypothetical protein C8J57DRAFT_1332716 [Mycena rebaudengoi]|nr:hypothetical protein C8J57DRAFT_1332716 [Mycena rebaudengoi]